MKMMRFRRRPNLDAVENAVLTSLVFAISVLRLFVASLFVQLKEIKLDKADVA